MLPVVAARLFGLWRVGFPTRAAGSTCIALAVRSATMNRTRFIAIAVVGVIAFGLILSAGESSEEPAVVEVTQVPTESPTATPEPTRSPESTATPQPAATSTPTPEAPEAPTQMPQPTPTESPAATPQPTPTATPETLSAAEHLKSLVVCGRVTVLASMYWGQAPGLAYAGNPATSGQLQQNDVIQFPNVGTEREWRSPREGVSARWPRRWQDGRSGLD